MSTTTPFGTQLIGQTEKTLNAILDRLLAGTGLTEPQWVALNVAVASGGTVGRHELAARVAGALKIAEADADARLGELAAAQLLELAEADAPVTLTDSGQQRIAGIRAAVAEITERLWGDLPADDLATAGRVLDAVLERASAELRSA